MNYFKKLNKNFVKIFIIRDFFTFIKLWIVVSLYYYKVFFSIMDIFVIFQTVGRITRAPLCQLHCIAFYENMISHFFQNVLKCFFHIRSETVQYEMRMKAA